LLIFSLLWHRCWWSYYVRYAAGVGPIHKGEIMECRVDGI